MDPSRLVLLAPDAVDAVRALYRDRPSDRSALVEFGDTMARREFSVFGTPVPRCGPIPWTEDWRFGRR